VAARNGSKADEVGRVYGEHFGGNCSKSLSCMEVCPVKIPTIASIAKLNKGL
jgi:succinate dehydrogenase / fumarate reductase iron-sulfur subunit